MKGRQRGRPTKWATVSLKQPIDLGRAGLTVEVWPKWKKTARTKLGTLFVSIGGLAWRPRGGKLARSVSWDTFGDWMMSDW